MWGLLGALNCPNKFGAGEGVMIPMQALHCYNTPPNTLFLCKIRSALNSVKGLPKPWLKVLIGEDVGDVLLFDMRKVHKGELMCF